MQTTTTMNDATVKKLQDLVRVNIDSAQGFNTAADQVNNTGLTATFRELAQQRRELASELRQYVEMNDEDAEDSGSIKGTMHQWWIKFRGTVSGGDEYALLAEAERGEDVIKERYEEVLKETAGSPVNDVLLQQYSKVKKSHDKIRDMRDAAKD